MKRARGRKSGGGKTHPDAPHQIKCTLYLRTRSAPKFNEFCDECHDIARLESRPKSLVRATVARGFRDAVPLHEDEGRRAVNRATTLLWTVRKLVKMSWSRRRTAARETLLTQIDPCMNSAVGTKMNNAVGRVAPGRRVLFCGGKGGGRVVLPQEGGCRGRGGGDGGGRFIFEAAPFGKLARAGQTSQGVQRNKRRREKSTSGELCIDKAGG